MTLLTLLIIGLANGAVGGCIGICGIAGFLLPMLYTGGLGYDVNDALALSFLAFLVSGGIGSYNYYKAGNLDVKMSLRLGAGSLNGAVFGVFLQAMIPKTAAKTILYLVVLLSGGSILLRIRKEKRISRIQASEENTGEVCFRIAGTDTGIAREENTRVKRESITENIIFLLLLGISTGTICSLSGAGGPVLVMPLLVAFGVSARTAVGVALFDSVFIAAPACLGYLSRISWRSISGLLILVVITHGLGVWLGSRFAGRIPVQGLKYFVALFSIAIAVYFLIL